MVQIEEWNECDMDNPLLKYLAFVKTVEKGSFTLAAQELNYAQSSISKMVADLEKRMGDDASGAKQGRRFSDLCRRADYAVS